MLTKRLAACAALVTPGGVVCDVGTDHAYLPAELLRRGQCTRAVATDIHAGPLEAAKRTLTEAGVLEQAELFLCDGLAQVQPEGITDVVIAGMGGGIVIHILTEGRSVARRVKELILQPQSELEEVRRFLFSENYELLQEDMILEDGKYYPMMKVRYAPEKFVQQPKLTDGDFLFGPMLLQAHHAVLHSYLLREQRIQKDVLKQLAAQKQTPAIVQRTKEVEAHLQLVEQSLW